MKRFFLFMVLMLAALQSAGVLAETSEPPLTKEQITQDVVNRFQAVYREKKVLLDKTNIDLAAAKSKLAACDQLSGATKTKCAAEASSQIDLLNQRAAGLQYDLKKIQEEMRGLKQD